MFHFRKNHRSIESLLKLIFSKFWCQRITLIKICNYETIKMLSNLFCGRMFLAVFVVILVLMCSCDSFKIKVKTKVKRRVDTSGYVKENEIRNYRDVNNMTDRATGRGFLPGLFSLGKVLNFFPVGGERECQPSKGYMVARSGICLNPYDCRQRDGRAAGDCAHGLGVCCIFEVTCGAVIQNNLTYFMSPSFPELWGGRGHSGAGGECNVTIEKAHAGVMQLRVDFVHFSIGQPNRTTGDCDGDVMTLGDHGNQFRICGQNHGQHIYYTLSTASEVREADELAGHKKTTLSITTRGSHMPRLWLMRLAQLPLASSAPHDCLQYFTQLNGTISTFNYAVNGRYLAGQEYRACIRRNPGFCAVRYTPCDDRSFRIGGDVLQTYTADMYGSGPGLAGGPGTGFYGPDGSFVPEQMTPSPSLTSPMPTSVTDQLAADSQNDPIMEEGMMPAGDIMQEDEMEGSGDDPQIQSVDASPAPPVQSITSRIWSLIWPSWLWGQTSRTFGFWSPYAQHYIRKEDDDFRYNGYGKFGLDLKGFGRQGCTDRITIPCDNDYFISNSSFIPGVCDPHHCGSSFCPGVRPERCHVQSSVSPFAVSVHFGPPTPKRSAEENIGACLVYTQLPCDV